MFFFLLYYSTLKKIGPPFRTALLSIAGVYMFLLTNDPLQKYLTIRAKCDKTGGNQK